MKPEIIQRMARDEARFWAMRIPTHTDFDDLEQQAATAMLEALRTVDRRRSVTKIRNYLRQAARNRCRWLVWENAAPVTGGMHNPRELRAGIECVPADRVNTLSLHTTPETDAEEHERRAMIRARLKEHARAIPNGDKVLAGLLREWPPHEIRTRYGLTIRQLRTALAGIRRGIKQDPVLSVIIATKEP